MVRSIPHPATQNARPSPCEITQIGKFNHDRMNEQGPQSIKNGSSRSGLDSARARHRRRRRHSGRAPQGTLLSQSSHLPRFLRIGDAGITDPGRLPPKSRVALAEVVGMPNSNASDYATVSQQATKCFQLSKVQNYRCLIACRPCFGSNCTFLMQKLNKVTGACVQISTQANKKFISWKNRPRISRG